MENTNETPDVHIDNSEYYTMQEVMKILRVSRTTAYNLIRSDGFPKLIVCRQYRIPKKDFEKWCKEHETTDKL